VKVDDERLEDKISTHKPHFTSLIAGIITNQKPADKNSWRCGG
jgi:hypothetical protein